MRFTFCLAGRKPKFIYFGGGTPSYLSAQQLTELTDRMKEIIPWDEAEEVTFECEYELFPRKNWKSLKNFGVTRLSLGIENFNDHILEINVGVLIDRRKYLRHTISQEILVFKT